MKNYQDIKSTRKVKVFLSSTFRDLEAERDYLAKNTFAYLEAESFKNNITLNLIDLRWGVTEEESKNGLVTQICLNEIENSRPFFIGIIGERYGWVPDVKELSDDNELYSKFPWIKTDIKNGLSITEIEIQYGVLRKKEKVNAFFYIKRDTTSTEGKEEEKLKELKTTLLNQDRYPVKYYTSKEELGEFIKEDILKSLHDFFPSKMEVDDLASSNSIQKGILRAKSESYTPINNYIDYINNFVISPQRLFVIRGESGTGKSALLAYWIKHFEKEGISVVYHFVNTAYNCDEPDFILLRLYIDICHVVNIVPNITIDNYHQLDLQNEINIILAESQRKFIYVIDGLNQLAKTKDAYTLAWLPKTSQNLKIICSITNENPDLFISLDNKSGIFYDLDLINDVTVCSQLICDYFSSYGKKLSASQIGKIQSNNIYQKPLVLFLLLNEIRLHGNFDELNSFIAQFQSCKDEVSFFNLIFSRLENENISNNKQAVGDILLLLSISRNGLSDTDISSILNIPQIHVSTLLYKCHQFISPLGIIYKISHDIIKYNILNRYYNQRYNIVIEAYTAYLENKLYHYTPNAYLRNYIYELTSIYKNNENYNKLHSLCVKPFVFLLLYQQYYRDLVDICSILSKQQLSILEVYDRLKSNFNSFPKDIKSEDLKAYLLKCIRTICRDARSLYEYKKALEMSNEFFKNNDLTNEYEIDFLCDQLEYFDLNDDLGHGVDLANCLIEKIGTDEKYTHFLSMVYYHKGHLLRKHSFEESASLIRKSIEYSKNNNEISSAAVSLINLAISYAQHSYYNEAYNIYSEVDSLIQESIKEIPSLIIQQYTCWKNLSALFNRMGNRKKEFHFKKKAGLCYLQIRHSEYQSLLHLSTIIDENASLADMMMRNGDIEEGIKEFEQTLQLVENENNNFTQIEYLSSIIEISVSFSKCYATNGMFEEALNVLMRIENVFQHSVNSHPEYFAERYLLYLQELSDLFSDLKCFKTACAYYDMAISEYEIVNSKQTIGIKSYLPDTYKKYARVLFNHQNHADAFSNWDKASNLYLQLSCTNKWYFGNYIDTNLEIFHSLFYHKVIDNYSFDSIRLLFDNLKGSIGDKEELINFWLFAGVKIIMLAIEQDRINEVEDVILMINHVIDNKSGSVTIKQINYILATSCSELSRHKYYDEFNIKASLALALLSDEYYNLSNIETQDRLSVIHNLQHCANCYDKLGDIDNAYKYYNEALKSISNIPNKTSQVVFREGGILYDYGIAAYNNGNITVAVECFTKTIQCYEKVYDEKSNVALQLADAEQALANIYDDTKEYDQAEKLYKSAIYVLENVDDEFSDMANDRLGLTLNNYGIMLLKSFRVDEARRILTYSREVRLKFDKYGLIKTDDSLYRLSVYEDKDNDALMYLREILETFVNNGQLTNIHLNEFVYYTDTYAVLCLKFGKIKDARCSYKVLYDILVSNIDKEKMSDQDRKNLRVIIDRTKDLFGNSDFLNT